MSQKFKSFKEFSIISINKILYTFTLKIPHIEKIKYELFSNLRNLQWKSLLILSF